MRPLVTTLFLLQAFVQTKCFIPNKAFHSSHVKRRLKNAEGWLLSSTLKNPEGEKSLGKVKNLEGEKSAAVKSIETLLEKQRQELKQTERLLEQIKSVPTDADDNEDLDADFISKSTAVASSLAACADYGFTSRSEGSKFTYLDNGRGDNGPPANVFTMAAQGLIRNLNAIRGVYEDEKYGKVAKAEQIELQKKLRNMSLNVTGIWEREHNMEQIEAPLVIMIPYYVLCFFLDYVFEGRYIPARFYFLETVARVPYFSYISMLHLYETLGWWRGSTDAKRIHFAEEWNEFHHLLIMESLGGDQEWWVRFLAMHSAIAYYLVLVALWSISPTLAYKFSELLETHAVNTYGQFLDDNEEILKTMPPPFVAVEYYTLNSADPLFQELQTSALSNGIEQRMPGTQMNSLYDVFTAIREDEGDHVSTMQNCLDENVALRSPATEKAIAVGVAAVSAAAYLLNTGIIEIEGLENLNELFTGSEALESSASASLPFLEQIGGLLNDIAQDALSSGTLEQVGDLLNGISEDALSSDLVEVGQDVLNEAPSMLEQFGGALGQFGAALGPFIEEFGQTLVETLQALL